MPEIKSPETIPETNKVKIFLAGSIEMDTAEDWQHRVVEALADEPVILLNPRREHWHNDWKQSKDEPEFKRQVEWELDALAKSDRILMYFDPHSKSPISLLEMGLYAQSGKLLVVCPEGFWRKGNVDIVCDKYNVPQFSTLQELVAHVREML